MPYGSFPYNIPAGLDINTNVGFNPMAVVCSNYSPYYIYLPDGLSYCPPWTSGAVIPLAHTTQARATWSQSPYGPQTIPAPPVGVTYTASLNFTDDPSMVLSGGTTIVTPISTSSAVFTAAPGATLTTGTIGFTVYGVRVDNYTGTWYQIGSTGILVPPWTTGFTVDLLPPVTSLVLTPATPPYGPANTSNGTQVVLTVYGSKIGSYGGTKATIPAPLPSFGSSGSNAAFSATPTATLGSPALTGDLIVAVITSNGGVITLPAGFTTVNNLTTSQWAGYKVAVGGENVIHGSLGGATDWTMVVATYRGFNTHSIVSYTASGATVASLPAGVPFLIVMLCNTQFTTTASVPTSTSAPIRVTNTDGTYNAAIGDNLSNVLGSVSVTVAYTTAITTETTGIILAS